LLKGNKKYIMRPSTRGTLYMLQPGCLTVHLSNANRQLKKGTPCIHNVKT